MRAAKPFLDSNVVLYLLSGDAHKADRAEALLRDTAIVSVQVLNEVTSVARRKLALAWDEVDELLAAVKSHCTVIDLTVATHEEGLRHARMLGLSLYDAMIVSSALLAGCSILYSEDMHHGLVIDKQLKIVNPFRR
jgi:predicted nucleic acid-binding protein